MYAEEIMKKIDQFHIFIEFVPLLVQSLGTHKHNGFFTETQSFSQNA